VIVVMAAPPPAPKKEKKSIDALKSGLRRADDRDGEWD
jgi:hypothetical protein